MFISVSNLIGLGKKREKSRMRLISGDEFSSRLF